MAITFKSLKHLKESGRQKLFIVPYFFTLANALFGFLSVIRTLDNDFTGAAYFIMLAGLMDLFDGKLARAFGSVSVFGMELDSLCDAVSFCFAPTILLYSWHFDQLGIIGIIVLGAYLCFGLVRLAKFNILSQSEAKEIDLFVGLPTTLAAFLVAQLVINYSWLSESLFLWLRNPIGIIVYILIIAFLMISPVRFPSFKSIKTKNVILGSLGLTLAMFVSIAQSIPFFFLLLFAYVSSCVFYNIYVALCVLLGCE